MGTSSVAQDSPVPARRTTVIGPVNVPPVDPAMVGATPGWYYDPADQAIYRYFDGEVWTADCSDIFSSEPPPVGDTIRSN